ncbi:MAG: hypothetical protein K0S22_1748 [Oscillospiraceae bacterium]|jgi:hypothetical protein|nr:hypothetical protein [Oscillospiraceae bacterium]
MPNLSDGIIDLLISILFLLITIVLFLRARIKISKGEFIFSELMLAIPFTVFILAFYFIRLHQGG